MTEHEPTGHEPTGHEPTGHEPAGRRPTGRRPEPMTLVTGVLAIVLAVFAFLGQLPPIDGRWVLAGAAALVGLTLLAGSVRNRPTTRDRRST